MRRGLPAGVLAALAVATICAPVRAQASLEYPVKANYLVRFAAFVQWPAAAFPAAATPVGICIVGADPFGAAIDKAVAGQMINGRPVVVRRIGRPDRLSGCHVVYAGRMRDQTPAALLATAKGQPVLTVTDAAIGSDRGMVHFVLTDNRVRFHIDDRSAGDAGLSISSRLLTLALSVAPRA